MPLKLSEYQLRGVTGGKEAMGEVIVRVTQNGKKILGRGASTDIIEASIRAYLNALNRMLFLRKTEKKHNKKRIV